MSFGDTSASMPIDRYLASLGREELDAPEHLWGFGGLHGGLLLAVLAERAQRSAPGVPLRSVTGRYHRAVRDRFTVSAVPLKERGSVLAFATQARSGETLFADATVMLGTAQSDRFPSRTLQAPPVPPPAACPVLPVPREFVPASSQVQVRLAGPNQPYGAQPDAQLLAWVRITTDDLAPDTLRLLFLLDVLAPSYSAVLDEMRPVPTLELGAQFTGPLREDASPWLLLSARTDHAPGDGWLIEDFDAWAEGGQHVAAARQTRIIRD